MPKSTLVIWNSKASRSEEAVELRRLLQMSEEIRFEEPQDEQESARLIDEACHDLQCIVAAGGDGTIHGTINLLHQRQCRTPLGIIPLGTANDLSRTLGLPLDPREAFEAIERRDVREIDLVRLRSASGEVVFANIATGGNSERIQEHLTTEVKQAWGPFAYLRGALEVVRDLQEFDVGVTFDDEPRQRLTLWSMVLANGRTGGSIEVAPGANPADGLLDVILIQAGTAADFAGTTAEFFIGDYLEHERVIYRQARRVTIEADETLSLSADGEQLEQGPFEFEVLPGALPVIVGPEYGA